MSYSRNEEIIELWFAKQSSPHTRGCYQRDVARILSCSAKSLKDITLADMQRFAQSLEDTGLAPISRARTLAAIKSLFGFCQRMRYVPTNPASELSLPAYEKRLAEVFLRRWTSRRSSTRSAWRPSTGCRRTAGRFSSRTATIAGLVAVNRLA